MASLDNAGAAIATVNKGSELAVKYTPKIAKNALTGIKHAGEWGVNAVMDNRAARWFSNKTTDFINRVSTGKALSFNANPFKAGDSGIKNLGDLADDGISQLMIILMGFLFFIIAFWCFNKIYLNYKNCKSISKIYPNQPFITNINPENPAFQYNLRDYYIKTAYNCCASGNYKNDYVNICALKMCINQGVRCLDFEIYSVNDIPVIASSSVSDFNVKESYNSVPFAQALDTISIYAFSGGSCPNPKDPLILNLRIMSSSKAIHDKIASALYNTIGDRLLGKQYSYENNGLNIASMSLESLMGKVLIIVDKVNPIFTDSTLNEYVNLASNAVFMRSLRYRDVQFCPDMEELKFYNKQNMSIVLPDLSAKNANYSSSLAMTYGCQMIAMSFQNYDTNMEYYTKYFDDNGSAFVLRPELLRYKPVYIEIPDAADPGLSYGIRKQKMKGSPIEISF